MKDDETLEHEVRASLRASATHPIPDELVSRISAIPAGQPSSRAPSRAFLATLASPRSWPQPRSWSLPSRRSS